MIDLRAQFVERVRDYVGTRFWHCGRARTGVDCVGLPICAARDVGMNPYDEERYTHDVDAARLTKGILMNCVEIPVDEVQAGDILLFRERSGNPQHVAVMTAPGMMAHACDSIGAVVECVIHDGWKKSLHKAFRWRDW